MSISKPWANEKLKSKNEARDILQGDLWDRLPMVMEAMKLGKGAANQIEYRMAKEADKFNRDGFPSMSVWVFFNVLTWYITHRAVSLNHRVELERRLRKAIFNFRG